MNELKLHFHAIRRFSIVVFLIGLYFFGAILLFPYLKFRPLKARKLLSRLVSFTSKLILKSVGVDLTYTFKEKIGNNNYFIVANHLSYIDILAISALLPCVFVTSIEMKKTPFLGQITDLAGCLYVERRSRKNIGAEVQNITKALESGLSVTVFPEAKATDGETVYPFKRSLYQAAIESAHPVLPITINYCLLGEDKVTSKNRDLIFWYTDLSFEKHLYRLCKMKGRLAVDLFFHKSIDSSEYCSNAHLRDKSYDLIKQAYRPIV